MLSDTVNGCLGVPPQLIPSDRGRLTGCAWPARLTQAVRLHFGEQLIGGGTNILSSFNVTVSPRASYSLFCLFNYKIVHEIHTKMNIKNPCVRFWQKCLSSGKNSAQDPLTVYIFRGQCSYRGLESPLAKTVGYSLTVWPSRRSARI